MPTQKKILWRRATASAGAQGIIPLLVRAKGHERNRRVIFQHFQDNTATFERRWSFMYSEIRASSPSTLAELSSITGTVTDQRNLFY